MQREQAAMEEAERAILAAQAAREENEQAFTVMQSTFSTLQEEAVARGKKLKKAYELCVAIIVLPRVACGRTIIVLSRVACGLACTVSSTVCLAFSS